MSGSTNIAYDAGGQLKRGARGSSAAVTVETAPPRPPKSAHPFIGISAVMVGAVISTLDTRITVFGLADVRGAVHAGFDEGAWVPTALTVGQMLVGPACVFLGTVCGVRRVLLISATVFGISNLLLPLSPNLWCVLACQLVSGIASGTFIPLTIGFVMASLPAGLVIYGVATYALNLEASLNIAASIEGWFCDHWSWRWIFWDTALLSPIMLVCVHFGMPRLPINRTLLKSGDWMGIVYSSLGFSLLYAALDQGNRLDWLNSGLIVGLLMGGAVLLVAFVVQELTCRQPWINLRWAVKGNIPLLFVLIAFFRLAILSTSYMIPQFLTTVQGYRAIDIGSALVWIALPQILIAPVIATILRFVDARLMTALGFATIACACFMAGQLTQDWIGADFLPSQIVQALGQPVALTSMVWFFLRHSRPDEVFTFGAVLQTGRLFGAELGSAFIQTFVRVREQVYSNLVGLHVTVGSSGTTLRLQDYAAAVSGRSVGAPSANARAAAMLANAVRTQANVLSIIDGFMVIGFAIIGLLLLMMLLRPPPALSGTP